MRIFVLGVLFCFTACRNHVKVTVRQSQQDSGDKIAQFNADDLKMKAAILKARSTYPDFLKMLKNPCKDCGRFNVKMRFESAEYFEHIWVENLHFRNEILLGLIANEPEKIEGMHYGDTVAVDRETLSDWTYVLNGRLIGGYTVKVIFDQIDDTEKKVMENTFGAKIR